MAVSFIIGSTDVTAFVDIQNYKMNSEDVYSTWTDGNKVDHRVITRQRIRGEVKLGFAKATDFSSFMTLLGTARTADGYYPVTAYVQNTGTTPTFNAFLDTSDTDKWDIVNGRQWQVVTVTVTGR